jgi:hypothetical protein
VHNLITFDMTQIAGYPGTERRVVLINPNDTFYGADLVQNDPWLRGDVIRMISHGREQDTLMMARNFPGLHEVYEDDHSDVWSQAPLNGHGQPP